MRGPLRVHLEHPGSREEQAWGPEVEGCSGGLQEARKVSADMEE